MLHNNPINLLTEMHIRSLKVLFSALLLTMFWSIEVYAQPANDLCNNAEFINVPPLGSGSSNGSTVLATADDAPADCGFRVKNGTTGGVWFTFSGAPNTRYEITTCDAFTDFNTELSVFEGNCGNLQCVTGNDNTSFCPVSAALATFSITTRPGGGNQDYYVYVTGNGNSVGNYYIEIADLGPPPINNDICETAEQIVVPVSGTGSALGSTLEATTSWAPATCTQGVNNETSGGVWYVFTSNSTGVYEITTCNSTTDFNTEFSVYAGTCDNLVCIGGNDNSGDGNGPDCGPLSTYYLETPDAGIPYYIYMNGHNRNIGNFLLEITEIFAVPAEIVSFTGRTEENSNNLNWITATEYNTEWFVIERSSNGTNWSEVGRLEAAGTSLNNLNYLFQDEHPPASAYYRLNTVDYDGSQEYSNTIFLDRGKPSNELGLLNVFPSPASASINVNFASEVDGKLTFTLMDMFGKNILTENIDVFAGEGQHQLDLSDLPSGAYLLELSGVAGKTTKRFIKE